VDARFEPVRLGSFDDEGGPVGVEAVSVQGEPAPWGFAEVEGEGVEFLSCAQPDETVFANLNIGFEEGFVFAAGGGRGAVPGNDEIIIRGVSVRGGGVRFALQVDAKFSGALLKNLQ